MRTSISGEGRLRRATAFARPGDAVGEQIGGFALAEGVVEIDRQGRRQFAR